MEQVSSVTSAPVGPLYRTVVLAFAAMCMLLVALETAKAIVAQDAVPFVAAGRRLRFHYLYMTSFWVGLKA